MRVLPSCLRCPPTRTGAAALLALLATAFSPDARAQGATPLERYQPAPVGDALFASPSASQGRYFAIDAGLVFSYASTPLALRLRSGATGEYTDAGSIVSHQAVLHAMASAVVLSRLKLDLDVPMTVDQSGDSPTAAGVALASPSGFAMNDLRLGARVTLLEEDGYLPAAALAFSAFLPTGDSTAFTGTGSARFEPRLILGADYGRVVWSASVARQLASDAGFIGSEVNFAAGIAARIDRFQIGPELFGSAVVDRPASTGPVTLSERAGGNLEALLGAKAHIGPADLGAAFGLGFLRGAGTPEYRIILGVSLHPFEVKSPPPESSPDVDAAGSPPPGQPPTPNTPVNNGANPAKLPVPAPAPAPADTDGDGVPDTDDACPKVVGDPRPDAKKRGCPPDRDGDGIYDVEDRCPDQPGVFAEGDENGCPPDTDGDGLRDPDDACPAEAGPRTDDPKTTGCPAAVRVEGTQIVILQQVNFETAKSVILPDSFSLLQQVADVLASHPEIARVAVDGHTDNRGTEASNLDLSRSRAVSVMKWLVDKGVDPRRLEARGFGPRRPIADNKTAEGRAKNRRVEFQIRKKTDKGAAGWVDGPIE